MDEKLINEVKDLLTKADTLIAEGKNDEAREVIKKAKEKVEIDRPIGGGILGPDNNKK